MKIKQMIAMSRMHWTRAIALMGVFVLICSGCGDKPSRSVVTIHANKSSTLNNLPCLSVLADVRTSEGVPVSGSPFSMTKNLDGSWSISIDLPSGDYRSKVIYQCGQNILAEVKIDQPIAVGDGAQITISENQTLINSSFDGDEDGLSSLMAVRGGSDGACDAPDDDEDKIENGLNSEGEKPCVGSDDDKTGGTN